VISLYVNAHVYVRVSDLPELVAGAIMKSLSFPNPEREVARREQTWGWEKIPEEIELWDVFEDGQGWRVAILPRGCISRLANGFAHAGLRWQLDDDRTEVVRAWSVEGALQEIELWDHQVSAVESLLSQEQGILQAPPGAGKTVTILEAIRRSRQRSLILTDKTGIARQWMERAEDHLGVEIGLIGDTGWDERDITVALKQSLWQRRAELKRDGFFERWGSVTLDEMHHVPASSYAETMALFSARYRWGASATPDRNDGMYPVATAVFGDILHTTTKRELVEKGILVRPRVERVHTDFQYDFHGTYVYDPKTDELDAGCPLCSNRLTKHRHNNNYNPMVKALVIDDDRNDLILQQMLRHRDRRQLVLSRRLEHLATLRDLVIEQGYSEDRAMSMTGEHDGEERMRVARKADAGPCIVFSTVADEAVDIPRMDTVHLAFPTANPAIVIQQVGRVERSAPGKCDAVVVDYCDSRVSVLRRHAVTRLRRVYQDEGYEVEG